MTKIPISRFTEISQDCMKRLIIYIQASVAFSLELGESTDIQDNLQLAVFICYISADVTVKEE